MTNVKTNYATNTFSTIRMQLHSNDSLYKDARFVFTSTFITSMSMNTIVKLSTNEAIQFQISSACEVLNDSSVDSYLNIVKIGTI